MKAINFKKSLLASTVLVMMSGLSTTTQAADGTFGLTFTTIPDVSIVEQTALDFGEDLVLSQSSTCTLVLTDDSGTGNPSSTDARVADSSFIAGTTYQTRTGECDNTSNGIVGKYTITGAAGVEVDIAVNGIAPGAGNFSFVPVALAGDYNNQLDGDELTELTTTGIVAAGKVNLATSTDTGTGGSPIPGQTFLYVAGTLTAQNTLTAGSTYDDQQFVIDVTY